MTTKRPKPVINDSAYKQNSDLKTNSDHKKQVSKKATVKTPLY